ncbi:hypothetical protein MTO96_046191 [Rhipicephalus appendiculatus]
MCQKLSTAIFLVLVAQMKLPDGFLPAIHVHSYRIRDFMNTRESIWTYNTTKRKRRPLQVRSNALYRLGVHCLQQDNVAQQTKDEP